MKIDNKMERLGDSLLMKSILNYSKLTNSKLTNKTNIKKITELIKISDITYVNKYTNENALLLALNLNIKNKTIINLLVSDITIEQIDNNNNNALLLVIENGVIKNKNIAINKHKIELYSFFKFIRKFICPKSIIHQKNDGMNPLMLLLNEFKLANHLHYYIDDIIGLINNQVIIQQNCVKENCLMMYLNLEYMHYKDYKDDIKIIKLLSNNISIEQKNYRNETPLHIYIITRLKLSYYFSDLNFIQFYIILPFIYSSKSILIQDITKINPLQLLIDRRVLELYSENSNLYDKIFTHVTTRETILQLDENNKNVIYNIIDWYMGQCIIKFVYHKDTPIPYKPKIPNIIFYLYKFNRWYDGKLLFEILDLVNNDIRTMDMIDITTYLTFITFNGIINLLLSKVTHINNNCYISIVERFLYNYKDIEHPNLKLLKYIYHYLVNVNYNFDIAFTKYSCMYKINNIQHSYNKCKLCNRYLVNKTEQCQCICIFCFDKIDFKPGHDINKNIINCPYCYIEIKRFRRQLPLDFNFNDTYINCINCKRISKKGGEPCC